MCPQEEQTEEQVGSDRRRLLHGGNERGEVIATAANTRNLLQGW